MAGAYSADLRERVLAAMAAGESAEAAARRFAVGRATAYRWARALRMDGRRGAKPMGGGPAPRIMGEAEAVLRRALEEENHLTLAQCRERLAKEAGVHVHFVTVHRALERMGWSRKKTRSPCGRAGRQRRDGRPPGVADG